MHADLTPHIRLDDIPAAAALLKPYRRIMLWGEMGVGKSTLALQLLHHFALERQHCLLLELDPGTPPFGIPGTICIGGSKKSTFLTNSMLPVCTLNSGRFRLPLILAARRLLITAKKSYDEPTFLIDPPGVVRGVGGAELLTSLAESLGVEAILVLSSSPKVQLLDELNAVSSTFFIVAASPAARVPTKTEKVSWRTRLWDNFLIEAKEELCDHQKLNLIGTPPPRDIPEAWRGKQIALLDRAGEPIAMGEVINLVNDGLVIKVVRSSPAEVNTLLIRDAGRNEAGHLVTVRHQSAVRQAFSCPGRNESIVCGK